MKVWLRVHGYEVCSWTTVWGNLRSAFRALNVPLSAEVPPDNISEFAEIWWGDPQFWRWSAVEPKLRVAIVLSEARSILKEGRQRAIANVNRADLVICPTRFAATAWLEAPIDAPIKIVPFGVDESHFTYQERDWSDEAAFTFMHGGVTQFRKGSWMVPEAFVKAFKRKDNVRLLMVSPRESDMFKELKREYEPMRQIEFDGLRQTDILSWYKEAHVYVSPHLSEGFGLMIPEAMSTGMPCIVSRCSAPREFFDTKYGWWIEMSENYAPVSQCLPNTEGFWRLPDLDSLADMMTDAAKHKEDARIAGIAASKYVRNNLTWTQTAKKILKLTQEVLDAKGISYTAGFERRKASAHGTEQLGAACS